MKALVLHALGESPAYEDFDLGKPGPGEVQVQVRAAALNHRDVWITKGKYPGLKFPAILGSDVAGICDGREVVVNPSIGWGENPDFPRKDYHILGMPSFGGFAETLHVKKEQIFEKPPHLDFEHAAALPLAGLTAYRAVFSKARLKKGENVLITGVGGGVAMMAMQFARAMDARVFVTSGSDEKIQRARSLGAVDGANYKKADWIGQLKEMAGGFDVVIDSAGGEGFSSIIKLCRPGARMVIYGGTTGKIPAISPQIVFWKQISILGTSMGTPNEFGNMLAFVRERKIEPIVDRTYSLEAGKEAFDRMDAGEQFGKIVLVP